MSFHDEAEIIRPDMRYNTRTGRVEKEWKMTREEAIAIGERVKSADDAVRRGELRPEMISCFIVGGLVAS